MPTNGSFEDLANTLEVEVFKAYQEILELLDFEEVAPDLEDIYEEFHLAILKNVEEVYEEVFGDGATINEDWLEDLGIDWRGIPNILLVCRILNAFSLGYMYKGELYNMAPQTILGKGEVICE